MTTIFITFFGAALATLLGVFVLRHWWSHQLILDVPNERSSHDRPVPRGAGMIIVLTTLFVMLAANLVYMFVDRRTLVIFLAGAGFVALISWLDDVHGLSNGARLLAQGMAALNALAVFGYWHDVTIPGIGAVHLGLLGLPLTFLWVIGLSNAFNFIDGIDGLAASQAMIAGIFWTIAGTLLGNLTVTLSACLLAGACFGFLAHNWAPARVFLGDVGSVFIGYTFAILAVFAGRDDPRMAFIAALFFGPVILDTAFTFLRRLFAGENVFRSHRSHIYQRLVIGGASHARVSLFYAAATIGFGIVGLLWLT